MDVLTEADRFSGLWAILPTAFDGRGTVDADGIRSLVDAHLAGGVAGLVVLGVMGEAAELSETERPEVVDIVLRQAAGTPLAIGVTGESTDLVSSRAESAARLGAVAVMVSPMPSVSLSDAIRAAAVGGLPIVIQDYPAGSGVTASTEDVVEAVQSSPLVAAVKLEAPPTAGKILDIRRRLPGLPIFGGLGGFFLVDELRAGATGSMTGFALPERLAQIIRRFPSDPQGAEAAWYRLLPLMRFEAFPPSSLAVRKEVWKLRGVISSAYCRRSGAILDDRTRADVARALAFVLDPD